MVRQGGHGIKEELIEKRYQESLLNLQKVLPLCDLAVLYDNTEKFRRFAIYKEERQQEYQGLCQNGILI